MKEESKREYHVLEGVVFLGTTTLRRMLSAAYEEKDPLRSRCIYSDCGGAKTYVENDPDRGDEEVFVFYYEPRDETYMTTNRYDVFGYAGSSAGFQGELSEEDLADINQLSPRAR